MRPGLLNLLQQRFCSNEQVDRAIEPTVKLCQNMRQYYLWIWPRIRSLGLAAILALVRMTANPSDRIRGA